MSRVRRVGPLLGFLLGYYARAQTENLVVLVVNLAAGLAASTVVGVFASIRSPYREMFMAVAGLLVLAVALAAGPFVVARVRGRRPPVVVPEEEAPPSPAAPPAPQPSVPRRRQVPWPSADEFAHQTIEEARELRARVTLSPERLNVHLAREVADWCTGRLGYLVTFSRERADELGKALLPLMHFDDEGEVAEGPRARDEALEALDRCEASARAISEALGPRAPAGPSSAPAKAPPVEPSAEAQPTRDTTAAFIAWLAMRAQLLEWGADFPPWDEAEQLAKAVEKTREESQRIFEALHDRCGYDVARLYQSDRGLDTRYDGPAYPKTQDELKRFVTRRQLRLDGIISDIRGGTIKVAPPPDEPTEPERGKDTPTAATPSARPYPPGSPLGEVHEERLLRATQHARAEQELRQVGETGRALEQRGRDLRRRVTSMIEGMGSAVHLAWWATGGAQEVTEFLDDVEDYAERRGVTAGPFPEVTDRGSARIAINEALAVLRTVRRR